MKSCLFALLLGTLVLFLCAPCGADEGKIGVVLIHGKQESSPYVIRGKKAGYRVVTPEMPWSRNRIYDASYENAMLRIDKAVEDLRKQGVQKVVVGGYSMGENAALGYAPDGPAVVPKNAAALRAPLPILRIRKRESRSDVRIVVFYPLTFNGTRYILEYSNDKIIQGQGNREGISP